MNCLYLLMYLFGKKMSIIMEDIDNFDPVIFCFLCKAQDILHNKNRKQLNK